MSVIYPRFSSDPKYLFYSIPFVLIILSQKTFGPLNKAIGEILQMLCEQYEKALKILTDLYNQLHDGFNTHVLPELEKSFKAIEIVLRDIYDETVKLGVSLFEKAVEKLKKFEPEFKKLAEVVTEGAKKIYEVLNKYTDLINKEINEIYHSIVEELKSVPGLDTLKQKALELYHYFAVAENIVAALNNIAVTVKEVFNVPDLYELLTSIISYVEKVN